jgi:glycosyltransferase involved in cell wall biosynthesis
VVITSYNHAHYLADALGSVARQTHPPDDVIVVDDGSTDDPAAVVARFPGVRMLRQANRGLSASRNAGLRNCRTDYVTFLDADDRLLPNALQSGLSCAESRPDCAFVYGGHRIVRDDGRARTPGIFRPIGENPYLALLELNLIGMHATVLYRRTCIEGAGGFDETLLKCEDYDLYLRLAQCYPVASHPAIVAEYRWHGLNMSADREGMLRWILVVLDRQEASIPADDTTARRALARGRANWRDHYAQEMLRSARAGWRIKHDLRQAVTIIARAVRWSPGAVLRLGLKKIVDKSSDLSLRALLRAVQRLRGRPGDAARVAPISRNFGFDRGTPVDRYYIESFLSEHSGDIRGAVLEIGDDAYTRRFGGERVERSEILHVDGSNPRATIVGDLQDPACLVPDSFDCIILTQTLHLVFDMNAAIGTLHRALKPGGVLFLTVPGITQIDASGEWGGSWYWSLTALSVRRLLERRFPSAEIDVAVHGNVFAAAAFLYGLAMEELSPDDLDVKDASYPVTIAARARKA